MITAITRLRPVDQLLVWLFVIYAIFIIAAWIYLERERIRTGHIRTLNGLILHLEQLTNWIRSDQEDLDRSWMDPEKWRQGHDRL
jgi:hypothetical protein